MVMRKLHLRQLNVYTFHFSPGKRFNFIMINFYLIPLIQTAGSQKPLAWQFSSNVSVGVYKKQKMIEEWKPLFGTTGYWTISETADPNSEYHILFLQVL